MRLRRAVMTAVVATALILSGCGDDDDEEGAADEATEDTGGATDTDEEEVVYEIDLTGDAEVPGPGAEEATGQAVVTVAPGSQEVCYELSVEGLEQVTAAHIHEGGPDAAGPIAVTLDPPTDGSSEDCVSTSSSIVDGLADGSRSFYVNVHTQEFPDGAVRGQVTD